MEGEYGEDVPDVVVNCEVCGDSISVRPYMVKRRRFCNKQECKNIDIRDRMREYRKTERGMAATKMVNQMYKRPDIERDCKECGDKFKSARKRNFCDSCKKVACHG